MPPDPPATTPLDDAVLRLLARPPRPPRDPALFTSGVLFGEPGTYPQGPPMVPAAGPADPAARAAGIAAAADEVLAAVAPTAVDGGAAGSDPALDAGLARRCEDPLPLAAAQLLGATLAAPAVAAFARGELPVTRLGVGPTAAPGRVVGPPAGAGPPAGTGGGARVVNVRYGAEHPAVVAPSLAHDLLWGGPGAGQWEEATLHLLVAAVHLQLVAAHPALAHLGTELTRRQNALALTLLNSRRPGSARITAVAPDGPGTIPGGAPSMQTPDFWSVPFVGGDAARTERPVDAAVAGPLTAVLTTVLTTGASAPLPAPLRWCDALGSALGGTPAWLPPTAQLRAAVALGALDPDEVADELAAATGTDPVSALDAAGLRTAAGCWERR